MRSSRRAAPRRSSCPDALRQARSARGRRGRARARRRRSGSRRARAGTAMIQSRAWSSSGALSWPLRLEAGGKPVACTVTVRARIRYRIDGGESTRDRGARRLRCSGDGAASPGRGGAERCATALPATRCISNSMRVDLAVRETLYAPRAPRRSGTRLGHGAARAHERQGRGGAGGRRRQVAEGSAPRRRRGHEDAARDVGAGRRPLWRGSPSSPATRWRRASSSSS